MINRPSIYKSKNHGVSKVKTVNELSKKGEYLKEKFNKSKITSNSNSDLGFKEFIIPDNYKGHDRGLYETLICDTSKSMFATYCRELELGQFKNNSLHGFGARYLYEGYGYNESENDKCDHAAIIGNFNNGLPNKKMLYYDESHDYEFRTFALTVWDNGKLIEFLEDYFDDNISISDEIIDSRFYRPANYHLDAWWEAYKHEFL